MAHPIDEYLEALEEHQKGNSKAASQKVAKSLGGTESTYPIESSLGKIFNRESILHAQVVDVLSVESAKRRGKNG